MKLSIFKRDNSATSDAKTLGFWLDRLEQSIEADDSTGRLAQRQQQWLKNLRATYSDKIAEIAEQEEASR